MKACIAFVVGMVVASLYLRIAERRGLPSCASGYVEAQSAADTALVDRQLTGADIVRLDAARTATCGELRLRGKLH
jgi:hypothetical protein